SVQERYLHHRFVDGAARSYTFHAAGYSLFVPTTTTPARDSLLAARAIADGMIAAGRRPSLHHAEAIEGEGRRLLDPIRGIYAGDFLKILRTAAAPAVLVEVGVIKNPVEEQQLSEPHTVDTLAAAIADAVAMLPLCPVTSAAAARTPG
ncbi:MAG TPA: N-acetylmuramoyl-L-alanine amidase, partial [Thalassobaculum sp.]